jgi:hypothetical protein
MERGISRYAWDMRKRRAAAVRDAPPPVCPHGEAGGGVLGLSRHGAGGRTWRGGPEEK